MPSHQYSDVGISVLPVITVPAFLLSFALIYCSCCELSLLLLAMMTVVGAVNLQ